MILSGWILPDMYEVGCVSLSGSKEHIIIVEKYLSNLKYKDFRTYNTVISKLDDFNHTYNTICLDDFAIIYLGWIKLIYPYPKCIIYSYNEYTSYILNKYDKLGYTKLYISSTTTPVKISIPSKEIL